ncbi:MAG: TetR/AcrR family transcriptional regulator [Paracoccaceae bacterium]
MILVDPLADAPPRKLSRAARRVQLIEATIETLATRGYARTTLTEVAKLAGLSHGLVNFHFQTKEKLLAETLQYLADEYRENWVAALAQAALTPAAQIDALLRADFQPAICTASRLSAWCAFWGEAQSRPLYQDRCAANDAEYNHRLEQLCADLMGQGGYLGNPTRIARALRVTVEGVWLDLMTVTAPYSRAEALATVYTSAQAFFPRHFGENGLLLQADQ